VSSLPAHPDGGGGVVGAVAETPRTREPGIAVEQHSPTRVTFRIFKEVWDGVVEVGRVEVDLAKHLDRRVSITVLRLDERSTGPIEVSMS
jgi:hypothetical protein